MIRSLDIHRRALAAAMAVVGRHRHAAGVAAMSVALGGSACLPEKEDLGSSSEVTSASEATTDGSTSWDDTALSDATGMEGSDSDSDSGWGTTTTTTTTDPTAGSGSSGTGESATGEGTTGDPTEGTTADTTTSDTTTGEDTTGEDTDGELSDCLDEDGNTDWECCAAQDWQPAEHCTPWGPPAPPRFDSANSPRLRPRLV